MEEGPEIKIDPNISCLVCGERQFQLREGFFYCEECGTQQEQVRAVEVEHDADFNESKRVNKKKIKKLKIEESEITSFECYNYILRGLVEDLLSFGAKEELKLMTLQLWAAYLRRNEVAFFDKKNAELPRLGLLYLKRDARALYGQQQERRKKRKLNRTGGSSIASGDTSGKEYRKSKRKLDESVYSLHSSLTSNDLSQSSANTSSIGSSTRAVQLKFSSHARKYLKKRMPVEHLKKHETDAEGVLKCHKLRPKWNEIKHADHIVRALNMKQLYTILATALNLIEDDLQLSDLMRFIAEGHLSTDNVRQYFPENLAPQTKKILREIKFYNLNEQVTDKGMRYQIGLLSKFLNIRTFLKPDILKLASRYVTDLNLPPEITTFVERLITLLPPQMRTRVPHMYPPYEARAMAYIIFVLKLMFGLDGHKEKQISASAVRINQKMRQLADEKRNNSSCQFAPLFVWNEWVEFIEMRKVIISHYNSSFCRQFNQCQSTAQLLEDLAEMEHRQSEEALLDGPVTPNPNVSNMQQVFQQFQERHSAEEINPAEKLSFTPSFVPSHFYFKRIQLYCATTEKTSIKIPEFMRIDHTQRTLEPFLKSTQLRKFFAEHNWTLKVSPIACTDDRCYVGIFRIPLESLIVSKRASTKKADFNITEEEWRRNLKPEPTVEVLGFKKQLVTYGEIYMKQFESDNIKREHQENDRMPDWLIASQKKLQKHITSNTQASTELTIGNGVVCLPPSDLRTKALAETEETERPDYDVLSMHSFDVFNEQNMEPLSNVRIQGPRRNLNNVRLLPELSDEDNDENTNMPNTKEIKAENTNTLTLVTSKMDCWLLLGSLNKFTSVSKKELENKFPRSFFWLLETCAQTIGVDWCMLYEQLLVIETMFAYGIEDLDDYTDCIRFKYNNHIKDINVLVNLYREIW